MSFTINLQTVRCLNESNEASASDEAYVIVTAANLRPVAPQGIPLPGGIPTPPALQVRQFGIFEDMDDDDEEPVTVQGPPVWGLGGLPDDISIRMKPPSWCH